MKILILSDLYPPYYIGGHEIRCKVVAEGLSKRAHKIFVLTSRYGINRKRVDGNIFRLLHYLTIGNSKGFCRRYRQIKMALLSKLNYFITKKIIKYVNPDIVYAGQIMNISIYPMKVIQNQSIPIVHHLGNYFFVKLVRDCILEPNQIKRFYRKIIFGFSSLDKFDFRHIIAVSEAVKKKYIEAGISEKNILVIPPRGIPSELIRKEYKEALNFNKKQTKLLYVGCILKDKGVHIAIEVVGYLKNNLGIKNVRLDIIGEGNGDYVRELYTIIGELKLKDYITFRGKMLHEEVLKEYDKYDILLVPSIWEEPFGMIIIEGMSQGLPIVASNVGGIPEIIEDGRTGLLVPPNDPIKMAESVLKLMKNPSLTQKISMNGIDIISKIYTNKEIINRIENYLNDVISEDKNVKSLKEGE